MQSRQSRLQLTVQQVAAFLAIDERLEAKLDRLAEGKNSIEYS